MEKKRIIIVSIIILLFIAAIVFSIIYYSGKYSIYFETGSKDVFLTQYVNKNSKVKEPMQPTKDGYVFVEWQLDGKKYDFDTKVNSDIVLTAKWVKEEYINVSFDTDSDFKIDNYKYLKGESLGDLPESYKENYEFVGWYLNDKQYDGEEIYDDVTLVAKYTSKKKTFNIGDEVIIIGNYSSSAYNINANYSVAIGWSRVVLNVIDDTNYPFVIGNNEGVTGFCNSSSIELIGGR